MRRWRGTAMRHVSSRIRSGSFSNIPSLGSPSLCEAVEDLDERLLAAHLPEPVQRGAADGPVLVPEQLDEVRAQREVLALPGRAAGHGDDPLVLGPEPLPNRPGRGLVADPAERDEAERARLPVALREVVPGLGHRLDGRGPLVFGQDPHGLALHVGRVVLGDALRVQPARRRGRVVPGEPADHDDAGGRQRLGLEAVADLLLQELLEVLLVRVGRGRDGESGSRRNSGARPMTEL